MSDIPSTELTFQALGSPDKALMKFGKPHGHVADYGHCDLVWSRHAPQEVFPPLIDWLDRHQPRQAPSLGAPSRRLFPTRRLSRLLNDKSTKIRRSVSRLWGAVTPRSNPRPHIGRLQKGPEVPNTPLETVGSRLIEIAAELHRLHGNWRSFHGSADRFEPRLARDRGPPRDDKPRCRPTSSGPEVRGQVDPRSPSIERALDAPPDRAAEIPGLGDGRPFQGACSICAETYCSVLGAMLTLRSTGLSSTQECARMGPESRLRGPQSREQQVGLSHVSSLLADRSLRFAQRVGTHEEGEHRWTAWTRLLSSPTCGKPMTGCANAANKRLSCVIAIPAHQRRQGSSPRHRASSLHTPHQGSGISRRNVTLQDACGATTRIRT